MVEDRQGSRPASNRVGFARGVERDDKKAENSFWKACMEGGSSEFLEASAGVGGLLLKKGWGSV